MQIENIKCSNIGIDGLKKIIVEHEIPTVISEKEWAKNQNYHDLFLHNLIYPYGVARKYYLYWIPKEEMIDVSIVGFEKGLKKYLESERDFRVGAYVVWWCMQSCIKHLSQKIWEISVPLQPMNLPKPELDQLVGEAKEGRQKSIDILLLHYQFLFEIIDAKYSDWQMQASKIEIAEVINRAIHRNFSLEDFMKEEYEVYKDEFEFEDIILLEYSLIFENQIKNLANQ